MGMIEIRIADLFGPICIDSEDGAKLCQFVLEALGRGDSVCLDFGGVATLASAFLNPAVGCLYASFGKEDLERRLAWKGLDPTDEAVLRIVQRNAIRFFAADKHQQDALVASATQVAGRLIERHDPSSLCQGERHRHPGPNRDSPASVGGGCQCPLLGLLRQFLGAPVRRRQATSPLPEQLLPRFLETGCQRGNDFPCQPNNARRVRSGG